ncbi:MAG: universal stress protein [Anaerolineae bacterium]|nr:universal stress protein [Anaerolineae bacterium]NIN94282.1 universal stress protein [Anaerolineae bacterium]NIQ77350.1 universal stress protein [Anaerolineae bacterium]
MITEKGRVWKTTPDKTILVSLDGSKRAERILPYVEELAERCEAEIVLLTVSEPPSFPAGPSGGSRGRLSAGSRAGAQRGRGLSEGSSRRVPRERC